MRKLIILASLLLFCFGVATSYARAEEVSSLPAFTIPPEVQYRGTGSLRGWMYHFPPAKYTIMSVDASQYLEGNMGYRGDPDALALSFLRAQEDNSCAQQFSGTYPGLYGRTDWLIWSKLRYSDCQPEVTIYARTTMRNRDDVALFGGTQDFNLAGHGRGITDRRICFGGLGLNDSLMYDCTTPSSPWDGSTVDPAVQNFPISIPVYNYADSTQMWEWLIKDHPAATIDKTVYYMAYLPVPTDASGNRLSYGFVYGAPDNHWGGYTINYLPNSGTSCTQTRSGRAYVRARFFMVADVPYRDTVRPWAPGNIVANPGTDTIDILIVAREYVGFPVEWSVSPSFFANEIEPLGGGQMTEVYAFTIDPQNSARSLFLASMNRTSPTCSFSTPTGVDPSICDGEYNSLVSSQMIQHKYYWRRPEEAMWENVVKDTTGAYHQITCNY
jgi:hypothetical protein